MDGAILAAVILGVFCGIPCMALGYLIMVKQKRNLLASWDDMSYTDPKLVGTIMGASVFIMGLLILMSSAGFIVNFLSMLEAILIMSFSVVTPLVAALYVNIKHTKLSD